MRRLLPASALLVALCTAAHPAAAQDLDTARGLYLEADFRAAREAFEAALESPEIDGAEAAVAEVHLAALASMFGDDERAREHAAAALALDPDISSPEGAPAGFDDLLADVAARTPDRVASLELEREDRELRARLSPALRLLAAELTLECRSEAGEVLAEATAPPPEVLATLPPSFHDAVRCLAEARNRGGATLLSRSLELTEAASSGADAVGLGRRYLWLWIGLGALALTAVLAPVLAVTLSDDRVLLNRTTIEGW